MLQIQSLSDEIVGVSYLIKSRLCESTLISVINRSLNSRAHSKDIGNAVHFIHSIFKLLAKTEDLPEDQSYLYSLVHGAGGEIDPNPKRRNRRKHKPRHYGRGGLALSNVNGTDTDSVTVVSELTTVTSRTGCSEWSSFFDGLNVNVQEMAPKLLYQLFCKKMLRYNKTHRPDQAQIERTEKRMEAMKQKYSKTINSMERTVRAKDEEIESMRCELRFDNLSVKSFRFCDLKMTQNIL